MQNDTDFRATRALIDTGALRDNIKSIRSLLKSDTVICTAVKANAYGHGMVQTASAIIAACGVKCPAERIAFAVAAVSEGVTLRKYLRAAYPSHSDAYRILVLSLPIPEEMPEMVQYQIQPLVFDKEYIDVLAAAVSAAHGTLGVNIAVDTGMGRIGCLSEDAAGIARCIAAHKCLFLAGMCTHFAVADCAAADHKKFTQKQFELFTQACDSVKDAGINPGIRSCANSAVSMLYPEMQLDMVRPGIIVYGYYAGDINEAYLAEQGIHCHLEPVMTVQSKITSIRKFVPGQSVGYGRTWKAQQPCDIGIIPMGYADGLFRRFVPGLQVTVNGKNYPVVGRICMDQCMINLGTNSGVKRWDTVTVFGSTSHGALQSAEALASATKTISYEITSAVSLRVPRDYI